MKSLELDQKKIEHSKEILLKNYFESSIIADAVNVTNYDKKAPSQEFLKIGRWNYVPKEWFLDPTVIPDFVFMEFGRSIALGEKKYLIEQMVSNEKIRHEKIEVIDYDILSEFVSEFPSSFQPSVLFVPIKYFVEMLVDWTREKKKMLVARNFIEIDGTKLKIFWSNKYVDFKEIIVANPMFGEWMAKPTVDQRLRIELVESEKDTSQMELKAETVFRFRINNPQAALVLLPVTKIES
jgi:hypothetical protein